MKFDVEDLFASYQKLMSYGFRGVHVIVPFVTVANGAVGFTQLEVDCDVLDS